jgi:hypothetical protein
MINNLLLSSGQVEQFGREGVCSLPCPSFLTEQYYIELSMLRKGKRRVPVVARFRGEGVLLYDERISIQGGVRILGQPGAPIGIVTARYRRGVSSDESGLLRALFREGLVGRDAVFRWQASMPNRGEKLHVGSVYKNKDVAPQAL